MATTATMPTMEAPGARRQLFGPTTLDLCNELNRATRSVMKCQGDPKGKLARIESNICQIMAKMLVSLTTFENILRRCVLPTFHTDTPLARESTNLMRTLTTLGDYVTYTMWDELHCLRPKLVALSLSKHEESNIHAVARFAEALRLEAIAQQASLDREEEDDPFDEDVDEDAEEQQVGQDGAVDYESAASATATADARPITDEEVSRRIARPVETFTLDPDGSIRRTVSDERAVGRSGSYH